MADPTPTPEPTPAPTPVPAAPWYGADTDVAGYLENRGLKDKPVNEVALSAIKAHRAAEGLIGAPAHEMVRLPKEATDAEGWNKVWTRLGRPADANGYDAGDKATDDTKNFLEFVRPTLLKHGTPKAMGEGIIRDFIDYAAKQQAEEETANQAAVQVEREAYKKELGTNYDITMAVAKRTAAALGVTPEMVATLEGVAGYTAVMKMFASIGSKMGEDKFISGTTPGGVITAEAAKDRIAALKADTAWTKSYLEGDSAKLKEMTDLLTIMNGGDDTANSRQRSGR